MRISPTSLQRSYDHEEPQDNSSFDEDGSIRSALEAACRITVSPWGKLWQYEVICAGTGDVASDCEIDTESEVFGDAQSARERYVAQKMKSLEENAGNNGP